MTKYIFALCMAFVASLLVPGRVSAQIPNTGQTGNNGQRTQGLQQTGQVTSAAAIQRQEGSFIGAGNGSHPRSKIGENVSSVNSQFTGNGAASGLSGLSSGLNSFGSTLGAAGGLGGLSSGFGSSLGRGGFGSFGQNSSNRNGLNSGAQGFGGAQQNNFGNNNARTIRVRTVVGPSLARPSPNRVSTHLEALLPKIPSITLTSAITVRMAGQMCVIEGSVGSQRDRELIERLAQLEPGIGAVQNDLTVSTAPQEPAATPMPELVPPTDLE